MKLIKYSILLAGFLLGSLPLYSQVRTLRGKVQDSDGPIPGVNVVIMNNNERVLVGAITDGKGEYYLSVPDDATDVTVNYSFIGYRTQRIKYTGQRTQDVLLAADTRLLEETVVVGRGQRNDMGINIRNVVAATEKVVLENIDELPVTSLGDALQGKLANVDIVSGSGAPGAGSAIRIRGISSLSTSSEPLIVLNGVPYNTQYSDDFDFATASDEDLSGLVNLSPGDIESVEVLKDAAATAIWGSRGANGVLLIVTRRGTQGKMTTTLTEKMSVNFEPTRIKQLNGNQYVSLMQDELWNRGLETSLGFSIVQDLIQNGINFNPDYIYWREYNQNTDWLGEITQNALSSETNLSLEGGGERATYRFSASYLTERGTTIGTNYNRLNSTLYLTYRFANNFRVNTEVGYSQGNRDANYSSDIRTKAMRKMANMSPYVMEEDGIHRTSIYFTPESTLQGSYSSGGIYNPVAMAHEATRNSNNRNIRLALNLDYDIFPSLKYYGSFAFTMNTSDEHAFLPHEVTGVRHTSSDYDRASSNASDNTSLYVNNKLILSKSFHQHQITATGVFDLQTNANASYGSAVSGGASDNIPSTVTGGLIQSFGSGSSRSKQIGFTGNLHYAYANRYLVQGSFNYGAQSRMNPTNRWKGFPSVGLSWRAENEPFMETLKETITSLKLRASWGLNGKAPGGTFPSAGRFSTEANYGNQGTVGPTTMELTKLKWEIVEKWNLGAEIELKDGKYFLSFDWYRNLTKDLLQRNVSVPSHTGYSTISYFNSGRMSNEGWELRGNLRNIAVTRDLKFGVGVNLSTNVNKILKLPENVNFFQYSETAENERYAQTVSEGYPMGSFYGFRCLGVYSDRDAVYARDDRGNLMYDVSGTPIHMRHEERFVGAGDAIYKDVNNDGVINKYDIVYLGNAMPEFTGGLSFSVEYKGWRLNTDFHYRLKYNVINRTQMQLERMYGYDNQSVTVLNRWRYEGDMTTIPKALYGRGYNTLGSDRFVEEGSYLRMKSLTLSYSLPKSLISRWGIKQWSFSATGYDIFTWTDYSGQDPEVSINGGIDEYGNFILIGVDNAQTPRPRKVSLNMTVKF